MLWQERERCWWCYGSCCTFGTAASTTSFAAIDKKQFFLPEIFFIGFGFMDMFKVNLKTEAGRKKEKKIAEIYGEKYAEYYHTASSADRSPMR